MTTDSVVQICQDYNVTAMDLRVATAVQLTLAHKAGEDTNDLRAQAQRTSTLLNDTQAIDAIRWASWVKHARENKRPGTNFDELIALRKGA